MAIVVDRAAGLVDCRSTSRWSSLPRRPCARSLRLGGACRSRKFSLSINATSSQPAAVFAKEMERVAAKEALILAIKDAGGLESVTMGNQVDRTSIEVYEKLLVLERLNPTPRPTTSPMLEGLWKFEWAGARSPAIVAAKLLIKNLPSALVSFQGLTLLVMDGTAKATYSSKLFGTIDTSFVLTTNVTAEGPLRLKEEYVDGVFAMPKIPEGSVPSQIQGLYNQLSASVQRLPDALKETFSNGLKIPLGGRFERLLLVSYLDEEIMVARDGTGAPDVLSRMEMKTEAAAEPVVPDYLS